MHNITSGSPTSKILLHTNTNVLQFVQYIVYYHLLILPTTIHFHFLQTQPKHLESHLNTAGLSALCTLPGVGESRARAILEYREQNGPFARVEDAACVPGLTQTVVDSWKGQATVS